MSILHFYSLSQTNSFDLSYATMNSKYWGHLIYLVVIICPYLIEQIWKHWSNGYEEINHWMSWLLTFLTNIGVQKSLAKFQINGQKLDLMEKWRMRKEWSSTDWLASISPQSVTCSCLSKKEESISVFILVWL